jgi:hypothetical protein
MNLDGSRNRIFNAESGAAFMPTQCQMVNGLPDMEDIAVTQTQEGKNTDA